MTASFNSAPAAPMSSFSNPDVQPPSLGQASPDRIEGMAGVMGMMYRGEMDNSQMGSSWGGSGSFGGNAGAGQFSSVPGNFGSEQQQQQQSWQQPPATNSSSWGGQGMPSASSFNSVPSNMGGQQPGIGSQNSWGQPQNSWQAPASSQSQPAACNPFSSMGSSSQQSGWNSQPQQQSADQAKLQQLLKLRERKQEILKNLQQAQAAAAAGGGCCGQPPNSSNFGTGGQMPCSGYGGQAQNGGFNMGGGCPQAPYPPGSQPCFGGGPQANMYSSPPLMQAAHAQNAW